VTPTEYLARVRTTANLIGRYLDPEDVAQAHRFIDFGEPAEGLCSLAWALVTAEVSVPKDLIDAIQSLTASMIDESHMPPNLTDFGVE